MEACGRPPDLWYWTVIIAAGKVSGNPTRRHLADDDWRNIEAAFRQIGTLAVGSEHDEAVRQMFTRLMNRAIGE